MLGSRNHKFSSIFYRLEGLLKNGGLFYDERPLWYDVYKSFPPRIDPTLNRPIPNGKVRNIIYKEDIQRAAFYQLYRTELLNMFKVIDDRSFISRAIKKCIDLQGIHPNMSDDELWTLTEKELQKDGVFIGKKKISSNV